MVAEITLFLNTEIRYLKFIFRRFAKSLMYRNKTTEIDSDVKLRHLEKLKFWATESGPICSFSQPLKWSW